MLDRLDIWEMAVVRQQVGWLERASARRLAHAVNKAGNGWLYALLAIAVFMLEGSAAVDVVAAAALAIGVSHAIYPFLKRGIARPRPFQRDPGLRCAVPPLDRFSCPSGHCMTATAAFVPLGHAFPSSFLALAVMWMLMAWGRLALAHHYPSDLLAGAAVGALVAEIVSRHFFS